MMVIGLTGGIGSGKTTVAGFFEEKGIPVYIADDAGKRLMLTSAIKEAIIDIFGEEAYSGNEPNRKFIASKVFDDSEKLEKLNGIIHPAVAKDFKSWIEKQDAPYVIYEAAILFETGTYKKSDFNILVKAPREERIKRLQKRDNSTKAEIEARMANQWSDEKKEKLADFSIKNTDLSLTKSQVDEIHEILLKSRQN